MNILKFAHYALKNPTKYCLRTASGRLVNITYISESDPYPIRGEILNTTPGRNTICQWDENGYPHNLPYTHGLQLLPYTAEIVWRKIDKKDVDSLFPC